MFSSHSTMQMSSSKIADWNNLIQKNVKTKDLKGIGNVIMVDDEFITILEGTRQEYVIPKKHIKEVTRNDVVLNFGF
jgi:hypothetical protein